MLVMAYNAKAIANTILDLADEKKMPLTPLKLLKLVYFAHGWHLALVGTPLLTERVEAWKFGPVAPSVYHAFKEYGMNSISGRAQVIEFEGRKMTYTEPRTPALAQFLGRILDVYGKLSGPQLSNLTHLPKSPWYVVWENLGGKERKGTDIPDELIRDYFKAQRERPSSAVAA